MKMGWQPTGLLLMLGACLLLQPTVVNGACCTSGQPTYSSHDIFVPSSGLPLSYLTCSDGPCSGDNNGVSFDYRTVSSSFESAKPLQCCDAQNLTPDGAQQGNTGSYYNPQQTSGLNWLPSFGYKFNGNKPIPGTGRPCDSSLPVVTCGIRGEQVETCQSLKAAGVSCGADYVYIDSNNLKTTSSANFQTMCCRPTTCADLKASSTCTSVTEYNDASDKTEATSFQTTCCQPKTCSQLSALQQTCPTDYKYKTSADSTRTSNYAFDCCEPKTCSDYKNSKQCASPLTAYYEAKDTTTTTDASFQRDCCQVLPTCDNTEPLADGAHKPYNCAGQDPAGTYAYNADINTLDPSTQNCCRKRVCSELRDSAARCDAGTKFADANADVPVNDFQQECCVPKTCSDISGSCGIGFTANPLTTEVGTSTEFTAVCCTPVPPTCGDTTPQIPGVEYDCSQVTLAGIWRFDETAKNKQNPTGDTCCKRSTCGELHATETCNDGYKYSNIDATEPNDFKTGCCVKETCADRTESCPPGYDTEDGTTVTSDPVNFTADCCDQVPATCKNIDPSKTPATSWDCSSKSPGIWKFNGDNQNKQNPSDDNCCTQSTCGSLYHAEGDDKLECDADYKYSNRDADTPNNFKTDCCVPTTCSDLVGTNTCSDVTEYNSDKASSRAASANYQTICCQPKTCKQLADMSSQCDPGSRRKTGTDGTRTSNFQQDCCESQTCADIKDTKDTCSTGYTPLPLDTVVGAGAVYKNDCCREVGATCADTAPKTAPGITYDCSNKSPGVWKFDSGKSGQTPGDNCCKQSSCGEVHQDDNRQCDPGYKYSGKDDVVFDDFNSKCCVKQTCDDIQEDAQCSTGYSPKPGTTTISTNPPNYQADCCRENPPTCENISPTTTPAQAYPDCDKITQGGWTYDSGKNTNTPPDCCKRLNCAEANQMGGSFQCSADSEYADISATIQFISFQTECCKAKPAKTCGNFDRVGTAFQCDETAGWTLNLAKANTPAPEGGFTQEFCCARRTCLDTDPNTPGNQLWKSSGACCKGSVYNTDNAALALISPPNDVSCCLPTYCGDVNPNKDGNQTFACPGDWVYMPDWSSRDDPTKERCCKKPTCGDSNPATAELERHQCCDGTVFNEAKTDSVYPSGQGCDVCCLFQTCGDMNPNTKEGAKSVVDFFPCADYGLQRNLSARTETHPNKDKCCMVPVTCASSGLTCPDKYTPIQANSNNVFTNFNSECCMAPPTCKSTTLTCPSGFKKNENTLTLVYTNFEADCCRRITCGDRIDAGATCNAGTSFISTRSTEIANGFQKDCCLAPITCKSSGLTCPAGFSANTAVQGVVFTNFLVECCKENPTCSTTSQTCPAGYKPNTNAKDNEFVTFLTTCCLRMNCGDMVSSGSTCTTGSTYIGESTKDVTNSFQQDCCFYNSPTCSNITPTTPGPAVKYDCSTKTPGAWVYDSTKDGSAPSDTNCCKRLSCTAARTAAPQTYFCPATSNFIGTDAVLFNDFTADCCQPQQAQNPTCKMLKDQSSTCNVNRVDDTNKDGTITSPLSYDKDCCKAATCADAKAAGSICSQSKTYGGVSKDSIAISTSFAVDCCVATGVTCAAAKASGQTCPVNYSYDSGQDSHIVGTDFKTDCCKPTCNAFVVMGAKCNPNTVYDPTQSGTKCRGSTAVHFQNDCCKPATCYEAKVAGATCPDKYTYATSKGSTLITNSFSTDCCKVAICADAKAAGATCASGTTYGGSSKDSNTISTNFASDCCVAVAPTCSAAVTSGQKCPNNYVYDSSQNSVSIRTEFKTDCCKPTCAAFVSNGAKCDVNTVYDSTKSGTQCGGSSPVNFQTGCCRPATCSEARATGATCPDKFTYATSKSSNQIISGFGSDCCKVATCADAKAAGATCASGTTYGGSSKDSNTISTSFASDCCVAVAPTCSAAKANGQKCPNNYVYDSSQNLVSIRTDFKTDCCKPTCAAFVSNGAKCDVNTVYDSTKSGTQCGGSSPVNFQTDCCRAATCSDAKAAGVACPDKFTYATSKGNTQIINSFGADCCTGSSSGGSTCKFSSSGGKCPVFTWSDVSSSFTLTAGSTKGKVNIQFSNKFVYNAQCQGAVSWITLATCQSCQKFENAAIGSAFTELKNVDCDSTIYVVAHDGSYKNSYSNSQAASQINLSTCSQKSGGFYLDKSCASNDGSGACSWPLKVECPSSMQSTASVTATKTTSTKPARRSRFSMM